MEGTTEVFDQMCRIFPDLPVDIIRHYVTQHAKDEFACTQALVQFQNSFNQRVHQNSRTPDENEELPVKEFSNLNMKNTDSDKDQGKSTTKNGTRIDSQRSVSDAGMPNNLQFELNSKPQTAPVTSGNYQGFNYAYYIPYGTYPVYNSNNNNVVYKQVLQGSNNSLLLTMPNESYLQPVNSEDAFSQSNSPRSNTPVPVTSPPINPGIPQITTSWAHPIVTTLPSPGSYMLTPQINSGYSAEHSMPTRRLTPSPHREPKDPQDTGHINVRSKNLESQLDAQLHVNIEPNDNPVHDWIPIQHSSTSPNYSQLGTMPIQFLPSPNTQHSNQGVTNIHQSMELLPPEQRHLQATPMWNQSTIPVIQTPPLPYYIPVHASSSGVLIQGPDVQSHLNAQRQKLNSLRYEVEKSKIQHARIKEEETNEEELQQQATIQGDEVAQLKQQISSLYNECNHLCDQVDQHIKGKALLGEINDDFYTCLNRGQQGPLLPPRPVKLPRHIKQSCKHSRKYSKNENEDEENKESSKWLCGKCTFANHPCISICEICTEPRNIPDDSAHVR